MSALFDLHTSEQPEFATTPNITAMPSTIGQRYTAELATAGAPDRFYNIQKAQAERYGKIIDDIHTMTGERLANPATNDATMDEIRENWGQPYPMIFQKRLDKLRTKAREVRSSMPEGGYGTEPGTLDPDMVNTQIAAEGRATREAAAKLEGTGGGAGAFAGGVVGSFENPFNILAMFIPASRAPAWLAEQAVGGWMRNVAKEAVYQGVTQAGAQAVSSAVEYGTRKPLGTEPTAGEIAGEIGGAAAGGFVLGGVIRGAVPAWLQVRRLWGAGAYVPTAVKDAAITLEGKAIYGDKNPLGVSASANESALDKAMQDVALNRPADVSHIIEIVSPQRPVTATADAARASHPDLMVQHDALTSTIDGIRARLNPTDETIAHLRGQVDEITTRIQSAGPQTAEQAARLGGVARAREIELQEAIERQAALARGEAVDTPYTASLRQQLLTAQDDLRALSPKMREALGPDIMSRLAEEKALPPQAAQAAEAAPTVPAAEAEKAAADARLQGAAAAAPPAPSSTGLGELGGAARAMTDNLYEGLFGALERGETKFAGITDPVLAAARADFEAGRIKSPADLADFVNKRGDFAQVSPEMRRLQKMADDIEKAPPAQQKPVAPTPEQPAGAVKPPGESPEDKAVLDQAKRMIESPEVAVPPEKRAAYSAAEKQEQEAKVAAGCLAGAI